MPFPLLSRRDLLRAGGVGVAATFVPGISSAKQSGKAKSVVLLWLAGGVTHIDSFDPKPDAPEEIRGTLATIPTTLPGIHFTDSRSGGSGSPRSRPRSPCRRSAAGSSTRAGCS